MKAPTTIVLLALLALAACRKERDPNEYPINTKVTFISQAAADKYPGAMPPLTIQAVSYRSPTLIKYFAKDMGGKLINNLSELDIKKY